MTNMRCGLVLLGLAFLMVCPMPSEGQERRFQMKVHLGPNNELEVDAEYRDPVDIDRRLNGTRVIPILLSVKNTSSQRMSLNYSDVTLDLGGDAGLMRLRQVDPATASKVLWDDSKYNDFVRFVGSQVDRFTTIDPFSREFEGGSLAPGGTKSGYVFFLRPEAVRITSFLALGTTSYAPRILKTNDFDVMSPETDSSSLWPDRLKSWPDRFRERARELKGAVQEITNGAPPYKKSYALLMGVSDYKFMQQLPKVKNDLDRMSSLLLELGFTVVTVKNEKLTMANVRSPQDFFANVANITPDDRLLVFFAGHGFQRREQKHVRGYLALMNARNGEVSAENTIAMHDFVAWTQRVPAKHLLVLLESCFSGLAVYSRPADDVQMMGPSEGPRHNTPNPRALYQLSKDPGRYLMMAGDENQQVPMSDRWGGGLFAHAVVEGLRGQADGDRDGFVTARELYPWLRRYVEDEAMAVLRSTVTPLFKDLDPIVSKGEFVFTRGK